MKHCHHCGAELDDQAKFCGVCGTSMEGSVPPASDATDETPKTEQETTTETPPVLEEPNDSGSEETRGENPNSQDTPTEQAGEVSDALSPDTVSGEPTAIEPVIAVEPGPAPKKSASKFIIGGIAVLAVIVIAVVAIVTGSSGGGSRGPSHLVYDAFGNTADAIEAEFHLASEEIGFAALGAALEKNGVSQELFLGIPMGYMGDLDIGLLLQSNAKGDQVYASLDLGMLGIQQTVAEMTLNKNYLTIASPMLFAGAYGLDLGSLAADLPDSSLGQLMEVTEEDVALAMELFDAYFSYMQYDFSTLSSGTEKELNSALNALKEEIVISEGETVLTTVIDAPLDCEMYTLNIPVQAMRQYLERCYDALTNDESFATFFEAMLEMDPYYSYYYTTEEYMELMRDSFSEFLDEFVEEVKEITFRAYLSENYTGNVVVRRGELALTGKYNDHVYVTFEIGTARYLTDAIIITMGDGEDVLTLSHRGSIVPFNGLVESDLTFSFYDSYYNDESLFTVSFLWDTSKYSDNLSLFIEIPDERSSLTMKGSMTVEGAFALKLDECVAKDWYGSYDFSFSYGVYPTGQVNQITEEVKDILQLNALDIYALIMEIESSIGNLSTLFWY